MISHPRYSSCFQPKLHCTFVTAYLLLYIYNRDDITRVYALLFISRLLETLKCSFAALDSQISSIKIRAAGHSSSYRWNVALLLMLQQNLDDVIDGDGEFVIQDFMTVHFRVL